MNVGLTAKIGLHSFHLAPEIIMLGGGGGDHFGMLLGVPTFLVASSVNVSWHQLSLQALKHTHFQRLHPISATFSYKSAK